MAAALSTDRFPPFVTRSRDTVDLQRPTLGQWALHGPHGRHELTASGTVRLGRAHDCDIVLEHPSVSRHHASITFVLDRPRIEDAGSRHGTLLNGQRVEAPAPLKHGDRIGLGALTLTVSDQRQSRAQRETLQVPVLDAATAARTLRDLPTTGEHNPASTMVSEIQLLVDAGEAARAASLVAGLLKNWGAQPIGSAIDEGALRRGSTAILRAVTPDRPEWIDALVRIHHRRGVLMHASTLDQLEAAVARAPRIDWEALAAYARWLHETRVHETRGEYGQFCLTRLTQILGARRLT